MTKKDGHSALEMKRFLSLLTASSFFLSSISPAWGTPITSQLRTPPAMESRDGGELVSELQNALRGENRPSRTIFPTINAPDAGNKTVLAAATAVGVPAAGLTTQPLTQPQIQEAPVLPRELFRLPAAVDIRAGVETNLSRISDQTLNETLSLLGRPTENVAQLAVNYVTLKLFDRLGDVHQLPLVTAREIAGTLEETLRSQGISATQLETLTAEVANAIAQRARDGAGQLAFPNAGQVRELVIQKFTRALGRPFEEIPSFLSGSSSSLNLHEQAAGYIAAKIFVEPRVAQIVGFQEQQIQTLGRLADSFSEQAFRLSILGLPPIRIEEARERKADFDLRLGRLAQQIITQLSGRDGGIRLPPALRNISLGGVLLAALAGDGYLNYLDLKDRQQFETEDRVLVHDLLAEVFRSNSMKAVLLDDMADILDKPLPETDGARLAELTERVQARYATLTDEKKGIIQAVVEMLRGEIHYPLEGTKHLVFSFPASIPGMEEATFVTAVPVTDEAEGILRGKDVPRAYAQGVHLVLQGLFNLEVPEPELQGPEIIPIPTPIREMPMPLPQGRDVSKYASTVPSQPSATAALDGARRVAVPERERDAFSFDVKYTRTFREATKGLGDATFGRLHKALQKVEHGVGTGPAQPMFAVSKGLHRIGLGNANLFFVDQRLRDNSIVLVDFAQKGHTYGRERYYQTLPNKAQGVLDPADDRDLITMAELDLQLFGAPQMQLYAYAARDGAERFGLSVDDFRGLNYLLRDQIPETRDEAIIALTTLIDHGDMEDETFGPKDMALAERLRETLIMTYREPEEVPYAGKETFESPQILDNEDWESQLLAGLEGSPSIQLDTAKLDALLRNLREMEIPQIQIQPRLMILETHIYALPMIKKPNALVVRVQGLVQFAKRLVDKFRGTAKDGGTHQDVQRFVASLRTGVPYEQVQSARALGNATLYRGQDGRYRQPDLDKGVTALMEAMNNGDRELRHTATVALFSLQNYGIHVFARPEGMNGTSYFARTVEDLKADMQDGAVKNAGWQGGFERLVALADPGGFASIQKAKQLIATEIGPEVRDLGSSESIGRILRLAEDEPVAYGLGQRFMDSVNLGSEFYGISDHPSLPVIQTMMQQPGVENLVVVPSLDLLLRDPTVTPQGLNHLLNLTGRRLFFLGDPTIQLPNQLATVLQGRILNNLSDLSKMGVVNPNGTVVAFLSQAARLKLQIRDDQVLKAGQTVTGQSGVTPIEVDNAADVNIVSMTQNGLTLALRGGNPNALEDMGVKVFLADLASALPARDTLVQGIYAMDGARKFITFGQRGL